MDKLMKVLQPPNLPYKNTEDEKWNTLIKLLKTELPADYKKILELYGTEGIDNFLWVLNPFANDENINFQKRMKELLDAYSQSKAAFPQYFIHEVYPSVGGLLPWAYTDNGDELYWLTEGDPDHWKIVVYESRSPDYHIYSLTMTEFLYQIVTKQLVCDAFPDDFPSDSSYLLRNE